MQSHIAVMRRTSFHQYSVTNYQANPFTPSVDRLAFEDPIFDYFLKKYYDIGTV